MPAEWTMPGRTLRARLIVSFAVVLAVTIVSVAVALSVLLPAYRTRQVEARLVDLARPTMRLVAELAQRGASLDEIAAALDDQAEAVGLRILIVGRNSTVLSDSDEAASLVGRSLALPAGPPIAPPRAAPLRGRLAGQDTVYRYVALPVAAPGRARGDAATLILAQSEDAWLDVWGELGWRLALAGVIALVAAAGMATLVARSLYRPIARLKAASEAMARGEYDQRVAVEGPAELAGLAQSFNVMADEVRSSRQSMHEFVANVSHELRTPLTSIRGFVEALSDGTVHDEHGRRRSLAVIDSELRRLQRLVTGLLDLSRFESGQAALRRDRVEMSAVLADCAELVSARAEEQGIELILDTPATASLVDGDADRLEQVVTNLLDNALRYTPPGGRVALRLSAGDGLVRAVVADTGPGVPPEALPHLFDRFYTADPARAGHGAGLGLAIAREIALAHGGELTVASRVGEGTTFTLILPDAPRQAVLVERQPALRR